MLALGTFVGRVTVDNLDRAFHLGWPDGHRAALFWLIRKGNGSVWSQVFDLIGIKTLKQGETRVSP